MYLLPNITSVMLLLWFLAWLGSFTYTKAINNEKEEPFECGFENTTSGDAQIRFKNSTVMAFLLVYDLELLLLLPISFNIQTLGNLIDFVFLVLAVIIYTCIWDIETNTLEFEN